MNRTQIEQAVLELPPVQRARLALAAWESLENDPVAVADSTLDPEGIALAVQRDHEIESGSENAISHSAFRRLTGAERT